MATSEVCLKVLHRYIYIMLLLTILCNTVSRAEVRRQERDDHSNCATNIEGLVCWRQSENTNLTAFLCIRSESVIFLVA